MTMKTFFTVKFALAPFVVFWALLDFASSGTAIAAGLILALAGGATYAVEVSPGAADQTIATGAVTIANGTTLAITPDAGTYTASDYKLISGASVSGAFTTVSGDSFTGLHSTIQYSATAVDLVLSVPSPPAGACG